MPTPTPSRGTPVEADDVPPAFVDATPTRPEPLVGQLPTEPGSEPVEPEVRVPRWRRLWDRVRRQLPYELVLLTMAIGVLRIVQYHWREGSAWIGGALVLAAVLRAVLPPRTVGMVAVRGRAVDVLWCLGLAACILFVAYTLKA